MYALSGIRVLDLSSKIAGPYCAKLFAEMGAEVIKIEDTGPGDIARRMAPLLDEGPDPERSALFFYLNSGKRGVTLNLKQDAGRVIFRQLVLASDIVVESFGPGGLSDLGLGFEKLEQINPRLVLTSISDFGHSGPYKEWSGSDLVMFAMSGLSHSSFGTPDRHPIKPFGSMAEHIAGIYASVGAMMAYYHSLATGRGQQVDISIFDCITSCDAHQFPMLAFEGVIRKRANSLHPTSHPMTIMKCKDGYISIAIGSPAQWQRLCLIAGLPEDWYDDDSPFMGGAYRRAHYQEINTALDPWLKSYTRQELQEMAQELLIPITGVKNCSEVIDDPQYQDRHFFQTVENIIGKKITMPGLPFKMSETQGVVERAPALGEHNTQIYQKLLGYSNEDLNILKKQGTI